MIWLREIIGRLFGSDGLVPTGMNDSWPDWLTWEHRIGHGMVWLAFMAIPAILWRLGIEKPNFVRNPRLVKAFAGVIALCGLAHFLELMSFYHPLHRLSGHLLVLTGIAAWYVLAMLWRAWPRLKSLKGPADLEEEIDEGNRKLDGALTELRALVECIPSVVWTARPDGVMDSRNRRFAELTGLTASQNGNTSWETAIHPEDCEIYRKTWENAVQSGLPYEDEMRLKDQNTGEYRWYLSRALPLRDDTGTILKWFGTTTDINDQKQAEETLRRSESELEARIRDRTEQLACINASLQRELMERRASEARDAVELAVSGILIEARTLEQAVPQLLESIGKGLGFEIGEYWKAEDDPAFLERQWDWSEKSDNSEESGLIDHEATFSRSLAFARTIRERGCPCSSSANDPEPLVHRGGLTTSGQSEQRFGFPIVSENSTLGILAFKCRDYRPFPASILETFEIIGREVTLFIARRAAERALLDSERRFRGIFNHTFQFVGITNRDGIMVEANETVLKLAALDRSKIVGIPCWETPWNYSEASRQRLKDAIARAADGHFVRYEGALLAKDDKLTPIDFSVTPLKDESGQVSMLILEGRDISSQKSAAEALRLSEEQFRGAFDAAAIGMALVAPSGRFLQVNRSLCEMIGYTEEDLVATDFQTITHPDDLYADLNELQRTLNNEIRTYQIDKRYFHKKGHTIWITLNVSLVRDASGQPLHFVSQIQDITRRKLAEEAQRLSESTIRSFFDGSPLMMGIVELWDEDIYHITGNAAIEASMKNYGAGSIHGRFLRDMAVPEAIRLEWLTRYRECKASGQPVRFEYSTPAGKGQPARWLSATACPIGGPTGVRPRFAYVCEDVTERKAIEQARTRLNAILEATSDFVGMADAQGNVIYLNRAGRDLLRIPRDESFAGLTIAASHPQWAADKIAQEAIPTALRDGVWRGETAFLSRDGREVPTSQVIIAHKSPKGDINYLSTVARDITEQRKAERALREARDHALAATKAKSTFLANMSHEIRTPMNAIVGMAELLLDSALDEQQHDYATTIRNSADSMLEIVNDILDLSKIEAGKMEIENVKFNLGVLIEEVAELFAPRAHQKGLQLVCLVPDDLLEPAVGDPHKLRQILMNLVGNAVKFTEAGEIVVEARRLSTNRRSIDVQISVKDSGIGIPLDKQSVIFETFTQADDGTTRRYGGTGLGLSICRQLARLMGGTIILQSEPGAGSTFSLKLTLTRGIASPAGKEFAPKVNKSLRALVVDTNSMIRRVMCEYLQSFGCFAKEAASPSEALTKLREAGTNEPFDLIFLDSHMPEATGDYFSQMIRQETGVQDLPIVLMCPNAPGERDQPGTSHVSHIRLFKPIRRSQLLNVLTDVIEARATTRKMRSQPDKSASRLTGSLGLRVLVADDHPTNRKVAVRMLESMGCSADVASDGKSAVEAITQRPYDVVLMDVQMPGMDGFAATAEVRRHEQDSGRRTAILAMTAHAMEGDRERCLDAGMDGYISKPVRQKDLREVLVRCITTQSPPETLRKADREAVGPSFSWSDLVSSFDGDVDFVCTLADSVLATTPTGLDDLRDAITAHDADRLHATAHGLKGNFLTIGANALAAKLLEMELAGRRDDIASASQSFAKVESLWEELSSRLREGIESSS